jgi:DNA ligase 1
MNSPHWKNVTFQVISSLVIILVSYPLLDVSQVFDIPSSGSKPFEERLQELRGLFGPGGKHTCAEVVIVAQEQARDRQHVLDKLKEVETLGGEGLMLRQPKS